MKIVLILILVVIAVALVYFLNGGVFKRKCPKCGGDMKILGYYNGKIIFICTKCKQTDMI